MFGLDDQIAPLRRLNPSPAMLAAVLLVSVTPPTRPLGLTATCGRRQFDRPSSRQASGWHGAPDMR